MNQKQGCPMCGGDGFVSIVEAPAVRSREEDRLNQRARLQRARELAGQEKIGEAISELDAYLEHEKAVPDAKRFDGIRGAFKRLREATSGLSRGTFRTNLQGKAFWLQARALTWQDSGEEAEWLLEHIHSHLEWLATLRGRAHYGWAGVPGLQRIREALRAVVQARRALA